MITEPELVKKMLDNIQKTGEADVGLCDISSGFEIKDFTCRVKQQLAMTLQKKINVIAIPIKNPQENIRLRFAIREKMAS